MRTFTLMFLLTAFSITVVKAQKLVKDKTVVLNQLKSQSEQTKTLVSDFESKKYLSFMSQPQVSSGKFYFSDDSRIRWEQNLPSSYIILVAEGTIKIQDDGKEIDVAHAGRVGEQIGNLIVKLVGGDFDDSKMFTNVVYETTESWIIKLNPVNKKLKGIYSEIELSFRKSDLGLSTMTFHEENGDKNVMSFSNQRINAEIATSRFTKF